MWLSTTFIRYIRSFISFGSDRTLCDSAMETNFHWILKVLFQLGFTVPVIVNNIRSICCGSKMWSPKFVWPRWIYDGAMNTDFAITVWIYSIRSMNYVSFHPRMIVDFRCMRFVHNDINTFYAHFFFRFKNSFLSTLLDFTHFSDR